MITLEWAGLSLSQLKKFFYSFMESIGAITLLNMSDKDVRRTRSTDVHSSTF